MPPEIAGPERERLSTVVNTVIRRFAVTVPLRVGTVLVDALITDGHLSDPERTPRFEDLLSATREGGIRGLATALTGVGEDDFGDAAKAACMKVDWEIRRRSQSAEPAGASPRPAQPDRAPGQEPPSLGGE